MTTEAIKALKELERRRLELLFKQEYEVLSSDELLELQSLLAAESKRKTAPLQMSPKTKKMSFG